MMETATGHPMRKAAIHTFQRNDTHLNGAKWIARFHPYDTYPVFFHGATEQAAIDAAEAIRTEAIEKYEAGIITRQNAKIKAAANKANKSEAVQ